MSKYLTSPVRPFDTQDVIVVIGSVVAFVFVLAVLYFGK